MEKMTLSMALVNQINSVSGVVIMYQLFKPAWDQSASSVVRLSDNAFIPMNPANTDYQQYLAWLAEGNEPLPAEE